MSVPALLVGLYPPAIRQRWGEELAHEVAVSGPRCWLDTVIGAGKMWARPSDWPDTTGGQTRRVLLVVLVAVTTLVGLLLRASGDAAAILTADPAQPVTSVWVAPVLAGLVLATPLPRLRRQDLWRVMTVIGRTLAAPISAVLALYLTARSGLVDRPTIAVHILLLAGYWTTLCFTGVRLCILTVRISQFTTPPSIRRLRVAAFAIAAGLGIAVLQNLTVTLHTAHDTGALTLCGALALLATVLVAISRDLRRTA